MLPIWAFVGTPDSFKKRVEIRLNLARVLADPSLWPWDSEEGWKYRTVGRHKLLKIDLIVPIRPEELRWTVEMREIVGSDRGGCFLSLASSRTSACFTVGRQDCCDPRGCCRRARTGGWALFDFAGGGTARGGGLGKPQSPCQRGIEA